jgi:hypothetical protein
MVISNRRTPSRTPPSPLVITATLTTEKAKESRIALSSAVSFAVHHQQSANNKPKKTDNMNKKTIKVRDLKPNKDAKGGGAAINRTHVNHTSVNTTSVNTTKPQNHGHQHN